MSAQAKIGNRQFGLTIGALFGAITAYGVYRTGHVPIWAASLSGASLLLAGFLPRLLLPINRLWLGLAHRIAVAVNYLVLAVILYGVLTPAGLLLRAFRGPAMRSKFDPAVTTYLQPVPRQTTAETLRDWF